jgi:transposase
LAARAGRCRPHQRRPATGQLVAAGRFRSEAAFAALAGPADPGLLRTVVRHRLNRSGDRQLNQARQTIALARLRDDPDTHAYAT